jgi:hypothetical protein
MAITSQVIAQVTLIPYGSSWNYVDNGSNLGTGWKSTAVSASPWKVGAGKFGYGVNDITTLVSFGSNKNDKFITTYFTKTLEVTTSAANTVYWAEVLKARKNGVVVYVNGVEVYRQNMPGGSIDYRTLADGDGQSKETTIEQVNGQESKYRFEIPLVTGTNVIAVEVHLDRRNAQDLSFDMSIFSLQRNTDGNAPQVESINRKTPAGQNTNATSLVFTVNFSESVIGVDISDFNFNVVSGSVNGSITAVTPVGASGQAYDVTVDNISGNGTVRLEVKNNNTGIIDIAGNEIQGGFSAGQTYIIDQVRPVVSSVNRQLPLNEITSASEVTFRVIFSENVTGVDATDFSLTGTASGVLGVNAVSPVNGRTYDVTVTSITGTGTLRLDLKASGTGIFDAVGNAINGGFTGGQAYTLSATDNTAPTVSITRSNPAAQATTLTTVTFAVTFSEAVSGVDATDFELSKTGTANGTIGAVSGSGAAYTVQVSGITGTGDLGLNIKAANNITDLASNALSGSLTGAVYSVSPAIVTPPASYGFATVNAITPFEIGNDTQHKPQGKTWFHDGIWWSAISVGGTTKLYRLVGTAWVYVIDIYSSGGRADTWVKDNLTFVFIHRDGNLESALIVLEYNDAADTYARRNQPATVLSIQFDDETATIALDGNNRLWLTSAVAGVAGAATKDVKVWYSDAPYSAWSGPVTIATGIAADDISAITKLPGQVGVMWSDQVTGKFYFRTHTDGAAADTWSTAEVPSQPLLANNLELADDHINMVVASDGTLYAAVKTGYDLGDGADLPLLALLVRRPNGTWDPIYTVTTTGEGGGGTADNSGTQPIVLLNEQVGKLKVVYTTVSNGGDIVYKESGLSPIGFGAVKILLDGVGPEFNFASSTHQPYNPEVVIIATKRDVSPNQLVGVRASDVDNSLVTTGGFSTALNTARSNIARWQPSIIEKGSIVVYPTLVHRGAGVHVLSNANAVTEIAVTDSYGRLLQVTKFTGNTSIDTKKMNNGVYYIMVNDKGKVKTQKFMVLDR